ncbi:peptide/nickel transport system ATP-binding protein [Methanomicrobium sp. W14]|jgi:peptide/nickel transport system ATP-binding protein|uniref:ABC transporter ATP-binding protein n=1 Tax=Methanomicrobium sp. W14 TaxID=2817839 RepID=UPI001AE76459|nr:ABC transporter ATP-binding protein [Methanomicrobium sp. W14]MBP2132196.1 peptide/nickel transport system ATP-binding protein [Methanomicrobium sp. W14]
MLKGENLSKVYSSGIISPVEKKAVDNVSIEAGEGETVAIVGESGCGKTTLAKMLMGQIKPTCGEVYFYGKNITAMKNKELRGLRTAFQLIPQHPDDAADPRWTLGKSVAEPLVIAGKTAPGEIKEKVDKRIAEVGLGSELKERYPHEVSGGELQRMVIARALTLDPKVIISDEATSMLDVSVQAQIMSVLKQTRERQGCALVIITHDLGLAKAVADRTYVMFAGEIVEEGMDVFENPLHPYTKALLSALFYLDLKISEPEEGVISGQEWCRYYSRCTERTEECKKKQILRESGGHKVRCIKYK